MGTIFEKLAAKAESDRLAAEHEWQAVVSKVADDAASEKEILAVLKACGRTLDDLQRDVGRQKRINELKAVVVTYSEASRALEEAAAKVADFNRERQAEFI